MRSSISFFLFVTRPVCPPMLEIRSTQVYIGDSERISVAYGVEAISSATKFSNNNSLRLFVEIFEAKAE